MSINQVLLRNLVQHIMKMDRLRQLSKMLIQMESKISQVTMNMMVPEI